MQVTVEATDGLERQIRVEVPEDRIASEVESRLKALGKNARVHGFRPGKVPLRVIERSYGRQVREEVVTEVVRSSFQDAMTERSLAPAAAPVIQELAAEPGQGLSYRATFEVYPQVTPPDPSGLKVERLVAEVTDQDVDTMLTTLRRQRREWEGVERAAASGDRLVLDYQGSTDGEAVPGGTGEQVTVELGTGRLVEGLEERLVGMRAGEEQTVTVDFPTDYRNPQIAGRTVTFQVKVHKVEEPRLPEVDEAFIRSFGVEEGGLDALRSEVRANMERELRDTLQARLKQQVMDALLGAVPLEVPRVLVNAEAERLRLQATEGLGRGAASSGSFHLPLSLFEEQARRRVALGLILGELARTAQVRLDPVRVRSRVESLASTYQQPEEVVRWYYADKRRLSEVESVVLEDQLVDWLLGRATVVDASTSFGDVMKPGQTAGEETS